MNIVIPDDYQGCISTLECFSKLASHSVVVYRDTIKDIDALVERFRDADAIVLTRERTAISAELLERLPRLKLLSQTGRIAGHIDLAACTARGVAVMDGQGFGSATAELTWALLLASRRYLVEEANRLRAGSWQGHLGRQLRGQRLGIWSYGRVGKQVAVYGRAFGMQVWVWGGETSVAAARADGLEVAPSREDFFSQSNVVSLHIRLNAQTRGIVTAADLDRMQPSSLLVNTSRAELLAPGALEAALRNGRPGYAAVDVYEQEPFDGRGHPLVSLPNALCTPHLGYVERDNFEQAFGMAFDNVNAFERGDFAHVLNPDVLVRAS